MGQSKTENFHFALQFKPIITAAYFDAGDESAQWENYNFELSPLWTILRNDSKIPFELYFFYRNRLEPR